MIRRGVGLPVVLVVTLILSGAALAAAYGLGDWRDRRMEDAASHDLSDMMDAIDEYQTLYNTLPRRLADLNKTGYHEGGGIVVCRFAYNAGAPASPDYLDIVVKHRAAERGAWTEYPSGQRIIKVIGVPECSNARRARS